MKVDPALIYLIIAALIWGATLPIMKITLEEIPVFSLVVLRMGFASVLLFPFVFKTIFKIKKEDIKLLLLTGLFGTTLHLCFFFYGLKLSHAIDAAVISATTPIFTLFLAHIFLKEKFTSKLLLGGFLSLAGVVLIIGLPIFRLDYASIVGNISLLIATITWVGHEIFSKKALKSYTPLLVSFATTIIGTVFYIPIMLIELYTSPGWYANISVQGYFGLTYGIIFSSLIAYSAWQYGLSKTTATQASFIFYLLPISGIIFSIILLGETVSPMFLAGSVLVLAGIIFAEYHRKKHTQLFHETRKN